jgi:hypothetical protein
MKKHCSRPLSDGPYGMFRNAILMVGANSRKCKFLVLFSNICFEFIFPKRSIVSMLMLNLDIELFGKTLKIVFAFQGFSNP